MAKSKKTPAAPVVLAAYDADLAAILSFSSKIYDEDDEKSAERLITLTDYIQYKLFSRMSLSEFLAAQTENYFAHWRGRFLEIMRSSQMPFQDALECLCAYLDDERDHPGLELDTFFNNYGLPSLHDDPDPRIDEAARSCRRYNEDTIDGVIGYLQSEADEPESDESEVEIPEAVEPEQVKSRKVATREPATEVAPAQAKPKKTKGSKKSLVGKHVKYNNGKRIIVGVVVAHEDDLVAFNETDGTAWTDIPVATLKVVKIADAEVAEVFDITTAVADVVFSVKPKRAKKFMASLKLTHPVESIDVGVSLYSRSRDIGKFTVMIGIVNGDPAITHGDNPPYVTSLVVDNKDRVVFEGKPTQEFFGKHLVDIHGESYVLDVVALEDDIQED